MVHVKTYKITLARQLTMLTPLLLTITGYFGICQFFFNWSVSALAGLAFIGVFGIIPTLAVHIQYLIKNAFARLTVNTDEQYLLVETKAQKVNYPFSAIRKLIRTSSYGRGSWYLFGEYRYYRIVFDNDSEYIVTCLLVPQIESNLAGKFCVGEERELKVVAFI